MRFPRARNLRERFEMRVDRSSGTCWQWIGAQGTYTRRVYGIVYDEGRRGNVMAHRAAWVLYRGAIDEGVEIDHLCQNTLCVNPEHLEPVTPEENNRRVRERSEHGPEACRRGHRFTAETTITKADGRRTCRTCHRIRRRARRGKAKVQVSA